MTIYLVNLAVILVLGAISYFKFPNSRSIKIGYLLICSACLIFIGGWRYGIGFDYYQYLTIFEDICSKSWSELGSAYGEMGFKIFAKLLSLFTQDGQMLYVATNVMMVGIVMVLIYRYSSIPFISVFLFVVLKFFYTGMNLVRYAMAIIICLAAYTFLRRSTMDYTKENRTPKAILRDLLTHFLPYAIIILIATSFHKSALIMLPVYFIVKLPLNKITGSIYGALGVVALLLLSPVVQFFSEQLFNSFYSGDNLYTRPGGVGYVFIPAIILTLVCLFQKKLLKRDPSHIVLINMSLYSAIVFFLAAFGAFIMTRVASFFYIFSIFLVPELLTCLRPAQQDLDRMAEIKREMKDANRNQKNKLAKENAELSTKTKDYRTYYAFGLGFSIVLGFLLQMQQAAAGDHEVFPYMSVIPQVNTINQLNFNNDREKKKDMLLLSNTVDRCMWEASDEDYILFMVFRGDGTQYLRQWNMARFEQLGLTEDLIGKRNWSYVAAVNGGQAVYEELSQELIEVTLEIEGLEVRLISAGLDVGDTCSIMINGTEYAMNGFGTNLVVYDKVLETVVDSVSFLPKRTKYDSSYINRGE